MSSYWFIFQSVVNLFRIARGLGCVKLAGIAERGEKFSFGFFYASDELAATVTIESGFLLGVVEQRLFGGKHFRFEIKEIFGGHVLKA